MKSSPRILLAAIAAGSVVAGCGGQTTPSRPATPSALTGVASLGTQVGAVVVMDASSPSRQSHAAVQTDGSFSAEVSGFTPPFLIKAVPVSPTMDAQFAIAQGAGRVNVNPVTTLAVLGASGSGGTAALGTSAGLKSVATGFDGVLSQLGDVLQPLLAQYGVTSLTSLDGAVGLDALLRDVRFTVHGDTLIVTDAATNQVIYQGPLVDPPAGKLDPASLPTALPPSTSTGSADGASLYTRSCASCHGAFSGSELRGKSAAVLQAAHSGKLTSAQADAVAAALSGSGSSSGAPGSSSGSASSGTGAIVLDGVALYDRYCGTCHGSISGSSVAGKTLEQALLFMSSGLSLDKLQAIIEAVNAASGQASGAVSSGSSGSSGSGIDGASVYGQRCASCHGDLSSSGVRGTTAAAIQQKHPGKLSATEATAVAQALSSAAAAGSAGNCGALDGVALYNKYCAMCHGGAISKSSLQGAVLDQVSKFMSVGLSKLQLQAIIDVLNGTSSTSCPSSGSP